MKNNPVFWVALLVLSPVYAQGQTIPPLVLPPPPTEAPSIAIQSPPAAPSSAIAPIPQDLSMAPYAKTADVPPPVNTDASSAPAIAPEGTGAVTDTTEPVITTQPYALEPPPLTLPGVMDVSAPPSDSLNAATDAASSLPPPPEMGALDALAIPSTLEVSEKKTEAIPTWKIPLKQTSRPVETNFNFRRVTLPSTIYRSEYDRGNRQLPLAQTNQLYDHYFLLAVARNDLNAIRALLANGYRDVNMFNAEGDTALILAIRHNAIAAARLLIARGADPYLTGRGGYSAYDYARQINNHELNAALAGIFG